MLSRQKLADGFQKLLWIVGVWEMFIFVQQGVIMMANDDSVYNDDTTMRLCIFLFVFVWRKFTHVFKTTSWL